MNKKSNEIRQMFLNFFKKKGHKIITGSPLIPKNDPSLLFTNAGMNQFKDFFLGKQKVTYDPLVTVQKCLRTGGKKNDLENVGYSDRHHTFFEMLGNFSFGKYFKKEAIKYAWELLTSSNWYGINKNRLWVTIHENDEETYEIWLNIIGLKKNKIIRVKNKKNSQFLSDNFWTMGENGPCGPSTEIFYNQKKNYLEDIDLNFKRDLLNQIEIWNIVFIQYNQETNNKITPLSTTSVDTGMGLERITRVLQNKNNNYDTDIFKFLKKAIKNFNIGINLNNNQILNVISDHIRSTVFLIFENIVPDNEGRGYVLRRIIRRALRYSHTAGLKKMFFHKLASVLIESLNEEKKNFKEKEKTIIEIIKNEEIKFNKTIERGTKLLETSINSNTNVLSGKIAFKLYDTFGFPIDLTKDFCKEKKIELDYSTFKKEMDKQKSMSFRSKKFKKKYLNDLNVEINTLFEGYNDTSTNAIVKKIIINGKFKNSIKNGEQGIIFLNKTTFFPESSGQTGDIGILKSEDDYQSIFIVNDTKKYNNSIAHVGKLISGTIKIEQKIISEIDSNNRNLIQNNHTATHLLHSIIRKEIGKKTFQKGSSINSKRLRFDFLFEETSFKNYVRENIEEIINIIISKNIKIKTNLEKIEKAKKNGAVYLFEKKYKKIVRVVSIKNTSIELCNGTHTKYTGNIGFFKIISEKKIGSNTIRIEAKTGIQALKYINQQEKQLNQISKILKSNKLEVYSKVLKLIQKNKKKEKEIEKIKIKELKLLIHKIKKISKKIKNINFLITTINNCTPHFLRILLKKTQNILGNSIIILFTNNKKKSNFIVGISEKITNKITSVEIIKQIKTYIRIKGGGKEKLAEGGGEKIETKIQKKISNKIQNWILEILKI
ncbi:Alanine--tRNA ligase [Buchnera aphidicola (Tetraneura ulmi)]|uniref:alanine--tRNA ligase n=1 Tax=Buchnera aphidicola TaxID=9 RepID=UPI0034641AE3